MADEDSMARLESEAALIYSSLFLVVLILMLYGIFVGTLFKTIFMSSMGHVFIIIMLIMTLITALEIIHIYRIYKCIRCYDIQRAKKLNSTIFAITGMIFSGLITGIILILLNDSLKLNN